MKVLDLQQTQDSLEERARQHGRLHAKSESQLAQLTQLRAELHNSAEAQRDMQQELAQKVSNVSGTEIYSSDHVAIRQPSYCLQLCSANMLLELNRW